MRIGEVARRAGLNASAIRYYEAQRLLPRSSRAGGRRDFDPQTIDRLRLIVAAQQFGFRLTEIREMLQAADGKEPSGGWRPWVQSKVEEIEANMRQMNRARRLLLKSLECACPDLVSCGKTCEWTESAGRPASRVHRPGRAGRV